MQTAFNRYGYTLIELMIVIAIMSILATKTFASYSSIQLKLSQRTTAYNIEDFLNQARNNAIQLKHDIYVSIQESDNCLGASASGPCDCSSEYSCLINSKNYRLILDNKQLSFNELTLAQSTYFKFEKHLGIAAGYNGSFALHSSLADVRVILSGLGRSRVCLDRGNMSGISSC
ncbi:prepilin-type N-terminal cleavage/methylation domain-containing protein [Alteromonas sp. 5E99-2]|uniref:prepilin-type N-terminal cleavage/methylation domain-containing protein n=1 Tax=Alteromonas sp. 5E99-2 TaxID=2817683 RepID=UPI001A99F5A7|nr:prepilin-type N-terminal cleavage/methylation domain-containing protein [Alteromonas sp. 5E99-2]MBO1255322.1 prepilin-type N-terminal cleavage/methylation domain-containing protein [Alteromonas sp. 5E99-2]